MCEYGYYELQQQFTVSGMIRLVWGRLLHKLDPEHKNKKLIHNRQGNTHTFQKAFTDHFNCFE